MGLKYLKDPKALIEYSSDMKEVHLLYSWKSIWKNAKPIQGQGKKQVDAIQSLNVPNKQLMSIKDLFPTNQRI